MGHLRSMIMLQLTQLGACLWIGVLFESGKCHKWALPVPIVQTFIFANAGNFALCVIVDDLEFNRGMGTRSNMYSYVYWQVAISSCKCKLWGQYATERKTYRGIKRFSPTQSKATALFLLMSMWSWCFGEKVSSFKKLSNVCECIWIVPGLSQREFHMEMISGTRQNDPEYISFCVPAKLAKNLSWVVIWHAFANAC